MDLITGILIALGAFIIFCLCSIAYGMLDDIQNTLAEHEQTLDDIDHLLSEIAERLNV